MLARRVAAMTADRKNLLTRREIVAAYVAVLDRLDEFVQICATTQGGRDQVRAAVQDAFGLTEIPSEAVLTMQMHRLSPPERQKVRDELAALDAEIERNGY
ncbi:hypothetical protein C1N74_15985 (plasmid) [Microbacterium sp. SGAir0570]|nr:hypothetical protein C1N74_15985 [Microbacterium sp. SGAir0570]